jgi:hypothetical protein
MREITIGTKIKLGGTLNVPLTGEVVELDGTGRFQAAKVRFSPMGPRFDTWYPVTELRPVIDE